MAASYSDKKLDSWGADYNALWDSKTPLTPPQQSVFDTTKIENSRERFITDSTFDDITAAPQKIAESTQQLLSGDKIAPNPNSITTPPSAPPAEPSYYVYDRKESSTTISQARNLFGGNIDVIAKLEDIVFEKFGDGAMRNSIAYIVPWKRTGVTTKTQASGSDASMPRTNALGEIAFDLGTDFSFNPKNFDPSLYENINLEYHPTFLEFDAEGSLWKESDAFPTYSVTSLLDQKGGINSSDYTLAFQSKEDGTVEPKTSTAQEKQKKLGSEIPVGWRQGIMTGAGFLADTLIKDRRAGNIVQTVIGQAGRLTDTPSGPIYIANPIGNLINQGLDYATMFGLNVPRGLTTTVEPDLQSRAPKGGEVKNKGGAAAAEEGAWQFLFNPEQLNLSVGPEFKATETWGVSDEANAGQPLHWSNHKNPELKFNKVLLNGYVFGKQVEDLEQGLIELFMSNGSNTKHGPQVLEFVWGKKSFGPCVIKDIQITEKMWDDGLLVNAEVSFTLIKVPEWTINDGQVTTYNPSEEQTLVAPTGGPTGVGSTVGIGSTAPPADSKDKPATGEPPSKKPGQPTKQEIAKKCINLKNTNSNLEQIQETYNVFGLYRGDAKQAKERLRKYKLMYDLAELNKIRDFNLTVPQGSKTQLGFTGGNFSPARIESGANKQWKKAAGSNPLTDANYPDEYVNDAIGTGVGYLRGSINNQVNSSTCTNAIAQTSQNG